MSNSDSDLSTTIPSNAEIEKTLRDVSKRLFAKGDASINSIRRATEEELDLEAGFFKDAEWKAKSKDIINDAIAEDGDNDDAEVIPPPKPKASKSKQKLEVKKPAKVAGAKRKADKKEPTKTKKRKVSKDVESEIEPELDSEASSPAPVKGRKKQAQASEDDFSAEEFSVKSNTKKRKPSGGSDDGLSPAESPKAEKTGTKKAEQDASSGLSDANSEAAAPAETAVSAKDDHASESEMSVLIDDTPPPKRRKSSAGGSKTTDKEKKPKAKASKETAAPDPDQEEIKKLQDQLKQCGIRKVWGKYLKPYETPRAKIKHLKEMLVDVGMTGRFSAEKAKQIFEQRELEADLEAVTEGNKVWGRRRGQKGDVEEEAGGGRPKRALAKGLAELDFISDGEED